MALFEGFKGLLALLVSLGAHALAGKNVQEATERLVAHLILNPANQFPNVIIKAIGELTNTRLTLIAAGALAYSILRFIEAYGLWHALRWTEWFALISGAIYLPFEIYGIITHANLLGGVVLLINSAIVLYMIKVLKTR